MTILILKVEHVFIPGPCLSINDALLFNSIVLPKHKLMCLSYAITDVFYLLGTFLRNQILGKINSHLYGWNRMVPTDRLVLNHAPHNFAEPVECYLWAQWR